MLRSGGFDIEAPFSVRSTPCHTVAERVRAELSYADAMTPLVVEGLVLDLFTKTHRLKNSRKPPRWLESVRERIETDFALSWTLRDYARDAGVHPVELAARFRRHYRCSVGEHIRAHRVSRAMRELTTTSKPIGAIALACGFSDQSHLTRVFKRETGVTPKQFRDRR